MTNRELLPLAEGSEFAYNGECSCGEWCVENKRLMAEIAVTTYGTIRIREWDRYRNEQEASTASQDAIAILHRAGLLDELMKKVWEDGAKAGFRAGNGEVSTPNPYQKAASDGE